MQMGNEQDVISLLTKMEKCTHGLAVQHRGQQIQRRMYPGGITQNYQKIKEVYLWI